ncbi:two-component response regulator-like APRR5 [Hibiscus syriacus]|nr:two-component response regulator-like APRR5 [Hibiscus syriacus]
MGEVVVSSEEVRIGSETDQENGNLESKRGSCGSGAVVNWGRFLPMPALRVLLVEADDSTRQIILALLRKCSYRVAAVPDGLKAWEMLKGRPRSVDLILTEVDLPSISGFALLTLIMEHDVCKNIPVIMMSSQDSVSTVYKCMLRGAADYLVKPIRRNELRNLWQHVWRGQSSIDGGNSPRYESVGLKKVEASSDNDASSNHSIGCLACVQTNKEQTEKGSDAQSSCTKPDMEAESTHKENVQEFSHLMKGKSPIEFQELEAHASFDQNLLMHQTENEVADSWKDAYTTVHKGVDLEIQRRDTNILAEAGDVVADSPREAIDFMGTFNKNRSCSINSARNFDSSPYLDLSLRRSNPNVSENVTQERPTLWHPNSSAFMRYTSRVSQPQHSTLMSFGDRKKDSETNSEKMLTNIISEYNSDTPNPTLTSQISMIPLTTGATAELKQTEGAPAAAPCTHQRVFPVPVSVKGIRLNNPCNGYNSIIPPIYCARSSSSMPSPSSANQQEPAFCVNLFRHSSFEANSSGQLYDRLASNTNQSTNQPLNKLDSIEDRGHFSPNTDQSASSSFCNGSLSQLNGVAYGSTGVSNGNVDRVAIPRASIESKNDESFPSPSGSSCRSIQREAALMKFRLKRKDRCYEKKVRYESRKKLAEQRPRVKGQFVRQVHANPTHTEAERHYGNSSDRLD